MSKRISKALRVIFFNLSLSYCMIINAQGVGIGTSTPNSSAKLEIKSTTKGVLIPSMTSNERNNIAAPAEGLLVYDITTSKLYQYQAGVWRYFIDGDYWTQSSTRQRVYNLTDSIGIGTSVPQERLHVNGDISATVNAACNGEIDITNSNATLQLQNGGTNTGFAEQSGNDLRLGTNTGNTTGNLVIRMNGTDRVVVDEIGRMGIGVTNPAFQLDVNGSINLNGNITKRNSTVGYSLVPLCYGKVAADGTIISGSGNFTVSNWGFIHCAGITENSIVFVNAISRTNTSFSGVGLSSGSMWIRAYNFWPDYNATPEAYQFVIFK